MRQHRIFNAALEVRTQEEEAKLVGHATVFNKKGEGWYFTEEIDRGAFTETLKDGREKFAIYNHNWNQPLDSTQRSLLLKEDDVGLYAEITPTRTSFGMDLVENVKAGIIKKMSFGFNILREEVLLATEKGELPHFIVKEVELWEVSPVILPFYEGTDLSVKGLEHTHCLEMDYTTKSARRVTDEKIALEILNERLSRAGVTKEQADDFCRASQERREREIFLLNA